MPPAEVHHARRRKRAPAADRLLVLLAEGGEIPETLKKHHDKLVNAIDNNADRIDYERWTGQWITRHRDSP